MEIQANTFNLLCVYWISSGFFLFIMHPKKNFHQNGPAGIQFRALNARKFNGLQLVNKLNEHKNWILIVIYRLSFRFKKAVQRDAFVVWKSFIKQRAYESGFRRLLSLSLSLSLKLREAVFCAFRPVKWSGAQDLDKNFLFRTAWTDFKRWFSKPNKRTNGI